LAFKSVLVNYFAQKNHQIHFEGNFSAPFFTQLILVNILLQNNHQINNGDK
jgi:hypothetical protein